MPLTRERVAVISDDFPHYSITLPKLSNSNTNSDPQSQPSTMYGGTLQTYPSCGHRRKFKPVQHCESYCHARNRCNGTVCVLLTETETTTSPALCVRCASRIEANIVRERNLITAVLENNIAEIDRGLWVERNRAFNYVALIFERARLREALRGFWEEREEELVELRDMQGMGRWDRVADLRDEWSRTSQTLSD